MSVICWNFVKKKKSCWIHNFFFWKMLNSQLYFDLRNFSLGGHINFYLKGELVCQPHWRTESHCWHSLIQEVYKFYLFIYFWLCFRLCLVHVKAFPERKIFSCVWLHFKKFSEKYFLVFGEEEGKDKPDKPRRRTARSHRDRRDRDRRCDRTARQSSPPSIAISPID